MNREAIGTVALLAILAAILFVGPRYCSSSQGVSSDAPTMCGFGRYEYEC